MLLRPVPLSFLKLIGGWSSSSLSSSLRDFDADAASSIIVCHPACKIICFMWLPPSGSPCMCIFLMCPLKSSSEVKVKEQKLHFKMFSPTLVSESFFMEGGDEHLFSCFIKLFFWEKAEQHLLQSKLFNLSCADLT